MFKYQIEVACSKVETEEFVIEVDADNEDIACEMVADQVREDDWDVDDFLEVKEIV